MDKSRFYDDTENVLRTIDITGVVPKDWDEIALTYTGSNLTGVVYKKATVTLVTLVLSYTGSQLDSITRTLA
jgi:hypothetical protein